MIPAPAFFRLAGRDRLVRGNAGCYTEPAVGKRELGDREGVARLERFGTVAIVGVGLIGGSIGRALRERGVADRVVGIGRDEGRLDDARRLGAIDLGSTEIAEGVAEADVVVVCTPVGRIAADVKHAASASPSHALVTDAGSTKRTIVDEVESYEIGIRSKFVAAHPIAGSERKGVAYARADLFDGRVCVLTPTARTSIDRLETARAFWSGLGCRLIELDPSTHDARLARTSHLPHAIAAALASLVGPELVPLAAGAYRDGTRVAGSDAALWSAIFMENRDNVLETLDVFAASLARFRDALDDKDEMRIRDWWTVAKANRLAFEAENQNRGAGVASEASKE